MAQGMIETEKGMIGLLTIGHLSSAESSNFSFTKDIVFGV
jgi:hypothetical protein